MFSPAGISDAAMPDYAQGMPEGDALHRAARRLQVLAGQRVEVETPHPRAAGKRLAEQLDGRRLEAVEAVGKNLLLRFEGGLVLRSHLRMMGRWRVEPRGSTRVGRPWLVLRGAGSWRWATGRYEYPLELRALHRLFAYQRPETTGF